MASPTRRRALMWTVLPILVVLNLLTWFEFEFEDAARPNSRPLEGLAESVLAPTAWLDADEEHRSKIAQGLVPVLVRDAQNGTPIGNAAVWLVPPGEAPGVRIWFSPMDLLPLPAGQEFVRTDAQGLAWIPRPRRFLDSIAVHDPRFGSGWGHFTRLSWPKASEVQLRAGAVFAAVNLMPPVLELTLDIQDPGSHASGELAAFLLNRDASRFVPLYPTGDGVHWRAQTLPDPPDGADEMLELESWRLAIGTACASSVAVTRAHFRGKPLAVSLEGRGSLEIELVRESRRRLNPVQIRCDAADTEQAPKSSTIFAEHSSMLATDRIELCGIESGRSWRVGAPLLADGRWFWTQVEGPTSAGTHARAVLDLSTTSTRLQGVLLDLAGEPLAHTEIWGELRSEDQSERAGVALTTGEGGNFVLHLPHGDGIQWSEAELGAGGFSDGARVTIELPASRGLETLEIGEHRMHSIGNGIVSIVDASGDPIRNAELFLRSLPIHENGDPGPWTEHQADDGLFNLSPSEVEGDPPFEVVVNHHAHLWSPGVLRDWEEPLTLTMAPAARVRGRVLLPPHAEVQVEILPAFAYAPPWATAADYTNTSATSPLGYFDCGPFPAGVQDLELRVAGILMARLGRVSLRAGETVAPPGFQGLDLRSCTPMRIHLAHAPRSVREADLRLQAEFEDGHLELLSSRFLLLPPEVVRVKAEAPACKVVWLPVEAGVTALTLVAEDD